MSVDRPNEPRAAVLDRVDEAQAAALAVVNGDSAAVRECRQDLLAALQALEECEALAGREEVAP